MTTYLVTGGCGFIGSHMVDRLLAAGNDVVAIDNLSTGKRKNLNVNAIFLEGSIADENFVTGVFKKHNISGVIHEASHINTSVQEEDPRRDLSVNVQGTINLMEATVRHDAGKFVYASSVAVYGSPKIIPIDEDGPVQPIYSYGIAKQCAEEYVRYYGATRGLDFNIARYGNIFGPRQPVYGEVGVIAIFTQKVVHQEPLVVFGDGEHIRDFLYIDDAVEATMQLFGNTNSDTYNIAMGKGCSVNDVVKYFKAAADYPLEITFKHERPNELGKFTADISKIKQTTGWVPSHDLASGILATLNYYYGPS